MEFLHSFGSFSPLLPKDLLKWNDDEDEVVKHISKDEDSALLYFIIFYIFKYILALFLS